MRIHIVCTAALLLFAAGCAAPAPSAAPTQMAPSSAPSEAEQRDDADEEPAPDGPEEAGDGANAEEERQETKVETSDDAVLDDSLDAADADVPVQEPVKEGAPVDGSGATESNRAAPASPPPKQKMKRRSRSVATPVPTCDSPECQKACGDYAGDEKDACVAAFANGCFEPKPPKDFECGDYTGIKAKALPMGDL